MKLHVLVGNRSEDLSRLKLAAAGRQSQWIVPKSAKKGDDVAFFVRGHGFVASGNLAGSPEKVTAGHWVGRYQALIELKKLLRMPEKTIQTRLPTWRWLRRPLSYTTPAEQVSNTLRSLLNLVPPNEATERYWIIKAKPDRNDYARFATNRQGRWYVTRPPRDWKRGDNLFVWAGAPRLQIIGLATLAKPDAGHDGKLRYFDVRYVGKFDGPTIEELRNDPLVRRASFLKSGPSGTVFPCSGAEGRRIMQMLAARSLLLNNSVGSSNEASASIDLEHELGRAAGFGDPETNRRVEQAAIKTAKRYYSKLGWRVDSVEREKRGYDLRCRKNGSELHVEVKGARGQVIGFIITQREYERACTDERFELCFVRAALNKPVVERFPSGGVFTSFDFSPLAYKTTLKRPREFPVTGRA